MKIIHSVLALLLAIAAITGFVLLSDPAPNAAGMAHDSIQGMSVGGDGTARLAPIGLAPYYFQVCVILLVGVMLYMGIAAHRRTGVVKLGLAAITLLALLVWSELYASYLSFLKTGETEIIFGFPVATNWMLWGVWLSMVAFTLFYVIGFRHFILPKEDEEAFEALVAEMQAEKIQEKPTQTARGA